MNKSMSRRLAAAEARTGAGAGGEAAGVSVPPMTAAEATAWLRSYFAMGALAMTPAGVEPGPGMALEGAAELAADITAGLAEQPDTLLILLTPAEIDRALTAIDAGDWFMTWATRGGKPCDYRPFPRHDLPRGEFRAAADLCAAVHTAAAVAAAQAAVALGYDETGDLASLRAWLAELGTIAERGAQ